MVLSHIVAQAITVTITVAEPLVVLMPLVFLTARNK